MKLISDGEARSVCVANAPIQRGTIKSRREVAQAQLSSCEKEHKEKVRGIIDDSIFEVKDYLVKYVHQWEHKGLEPTFGGIWDMIRCIGKERIDIALKQKYLED